MARRVCGATLAIAARVLPQLCSHFAHTSRSLPRQDKALTNKIAGQQRVQHFLPSCLLAVQGSLTYSVLLPACCALRRIHGSVTVYSRLRNASNFPRTPFSVVQRTRGRVPKQWQNRGGPSNPPARGGLWCLRGGCLTSPGRVPVIARRGWVTVGHSR